MMSDEHRTAVIDALNTNKLIFPRWYGRAILSFLALVRFVTPFVLEEADVYIAGWIYEENGRYEVSVSRMRAIDMRYPI